MAIYCYNCSFYPVEHEHIIVINVGPGIIVYRAAALPGTTVARPLR